MRQKEKGQGLEQDLKPEQKAREEIDKIGRASCRERVSWTV